MKKLIITAIVLAIATPAVALIYPPHSPEFPCCDNSGQVIWEFLEDGCMPTSEVADPPYYFNPDLPNPTFGTRYLDGGPDWTWSAGTYLVENEDSLNQPIPISDDKPYLRMFFEVTHTLVESEDESLIGMGLEVWGLQDWTGCPALSGNDGDIGPYLGGYEFPVPTATFDVGGGWYQSYWEFDFSEDGSVGDEFDLPEVSHTTAIIGMGDFGAAGFQLEEVYLNYIWFAETDGSDIPTEDCESIVIASKKAIIANVPEKLYEPQDDPCTPVAQGPTSGTLDVKLAWRPGENLGYPNFTATVLVDPDPNQEITYHSDFRLTDSTEPNDNVTLTFTQANWDTFQQVNVVITDDQELEGTEVTNVEYVVTIDIDDPNFGGPGYDPVSKKRGFVIVDNDIPFIAYELVDPCKPLVGTLTENDPCIPVCVGVRLSHIPDSDVDVFVFRESEFGLLLDTMSAMDPPLGEADDPNRLTFTPANYRTLQNICIEAFDDEDRPDAESEWIPGVIIMEPSSEDARYDLEGESDFAIEALELDFDVQDNECGAWGFDPMDTNEDCVVSLSEIVAVYADWQNCTDPYDAGLNAWGDCAAAWAEEEEEE
ncbi:MAG: hypothetical protein ACYSWP_22265 [Planctomycetota bacterium]|jgi:hypothetical protein